MTVFNKLGRALRLPFLSLITLLLLLQTTQAQEAAKTLEWGEHANWRCLKRGDPDSKIAYDLELEDIFIDGRSVLVGEPFVGDVRDLVFVVKNISDRPFAFIQITVILLEVKTALQMPFVRSAESKARPVAPGEQAELRMPKGKIYDWVKASVVSQGAELSTIRRAAIDDFSVGQIARACATARDPRNQPPPR
jgi:hypothetical protein